MAVNKHSGLYKSLVLLAGMWAFTAGCSDSSPDELHVDVNGDGEKDLVTYSSLNEQGQGSSNISVRLCSKGVYGSAQTLYLKHAPVTTIVEDVTGDGKPDIFYSSASPFWPFNRTFYLACANGDGTFQEPRLVAKLDNVILTDFRVEHADSDSIADIVFTIKNGIFKDNRLNYVARGNGDGTFQMPKEK